MQYKSRIALQLVWGSSVREGALNGEGRRGGGVEGGFDNKNSHDDGEGGKAQKKEPW